MDEGEEGAARVTGTKRRRSPAQGVVCRCLWHRGGNDVTPPGAAPRGEVGSRWGSHGIGVGGRRVGVAGKGEVAVQ